MQEFRFLGFQVSKPTNLNIENTQYNKQQKLVLTQRNAKKIAKMELQTTTTDSIPIQLTIDINARQRFSRPRSAGTPWEYIGPDCFLHFAFRIKPLIQQFQYRFRIARDDGCRICIEDFALRTPVSVRISYTDFAFRDGFLKNYARNVSLSPRVYI